MTARIEKPKNKQFSYFFSSGYTFTMGLRLNPHNSRDNKQLRHAFCKHVNNITRNKETQIILLFLF